MSALLQENEPFIPKKHDIVLATKSSRALAALIPKKEKDFSMTVNVDNRESKIIIPFSAIKLLLQILTQMAEGNAVTIIPIHAELTTQEAANLLNVSRPFLIKLLETKEIRFHKVGTHRRVYFADILSYKAKVDAKSKEALNALAKQAQELDMGY